MSIVESQKSSVDDANHLLAQWLERLDQLVQRVESWARELDWTTRRIQKKMEDSRVGTYKSPALALQKDTFRILLEPISRAAPGAEGVVDLYLMPAYDDIASLYYYNGDWQLHYTFADSQAIAKIRERGHKPLSRESLKEVLVEMIKNAS